MEVSLRIGIPAKQEFYTPETVKVWNTLKKELDSHDKKVTSHNAARAKIAGSNIETVSAEDLYDGHASTRFRFALARKAVELFDKAAEFAKLHQADKNAELQKLKDEMEAKRKQLRGQMTELGYAPDRLREGHEHGVNQISMSHPDVIELRKKIASLSGGSRPISGDRNVLVACIERMASAELKVA